MPKGQLAVDGGADIWCTHCYTISKRKSSRKKYQLIFAAPRSILVYYYLAPTTYFVTRTLFISGFLQTQEEGVFR